MLFNTRLRKQQRLLCRQYKIWSPLKTMMCQSVSSTVAQRSLWSQQFLRHIWVSLVLQKDELTSRKRSNSISWYVGCFMWYRPNTWRKHYAKVPGTYVPYIVTDWSASLQKFREYLEGSNLITKLQAKHDLLQRTLGEGKYHTINWKVIPDSSVNPLTC